MGKSQSAAYQGQIFDNATQKWVPVCDKIAALEAAALPQADAVVHTLTVHDGRAAAANVTDKFNYGSGSEPTNLIFVPTLSQLGYSSDDYKLKAILQANVRTNTPPQDASIALFDAAGNQVDGSVATATLDGDADTDNVITSSPVDVVGGNGYAGDARLNTDGDLENVVLQSTTLIVQVVKK